MTFNISKCVVLSKGEANSSVLYHLNNQQLRNVNSHPYLGIELQHDLKWTNHHEKILSKANRSLGMLRRVLKDADTQTRKIAFITLIRPVLEYGCMIFDPY